jgi:hypothetical protein
MEDLWEDLGAVVRITLKWSLKYWIGEHAMDISVSEYGQVEGSC